MTLCICDVLGRLVRGCPLHAPIWQATPESTHVMLIRILQNQEKIMAAQDDVNAAVTAIQAVVTDLGTAATNIQAEIANLNAQIAAGGGQPVDTTALDTAVTALKQAQAGVDALETPAPAPAPAEPAAPPAS